MQKNNVNRAIKRQARVREGPHAYSALLYTQCRRTAGTRWKVAIPKKGSKGMGKRGTRGGPPRALKSDALHSQPAPSTSNSPNLPHHNNSMCRPGLPLLSTFVWTQSAWSVQRVLRSRLSSSFWTTPAHHTRIFASIADFAQLLLDIHPRAHLVRKRSYFPIRLLGSLS